MNRRLLLVPIVGAAALAGSQLVGDGTEVPPEPVFPTVVDQADQGWVADSWSVNRFVDDPFEPNRTDAADADDSDPDATTDGQVTPTDDSTRDADADAGFEDAGFEDEGALPAPTASSAPAPAALPPAAPIPEDGGVEVPEIDDLPPAR